MKTQNSFKSIKSASTLVFAFTAILILLSGFSARALIISKDDNSLALTNTAAWVGGVVPGPSDIARWDSTVTSANTVILGTNLAWSGIQIANPNGPVQINAGSTLTNGAAGIDMSAATQNLTLNNAITIAPGSLQKWNIGSGLTLTATLPFKNQVASDGAVQFSTTGTINLGSTTANIIYDGNNNPWATYGQSDWAALNAGQVIAATYTAATTAFTAAANNDVLGDFNINTTVDVASIRFNDAAAHNLAVSSSGTSRTLTAHGILITPNSGGGSIGGTATSSFVRASRGSGGAGEVLYVFQNSASDFTIGAIIANNNVAGYLAKHGPGNLILSNRANAYSGGTFVDGGTLTVNSNANMGAGGSVAVNAGTLAVFNGTIVSPVTSINFAGGTTNKITTSSADGQFICGANYVNNGALWLQFNYGNGVPFSTTTAPFFAESNLVVNGAVSVAVQSGNASVGQFPLIKWTNAISAITFANFTLAALPLRTQGYLSNNMANSSIDLVITNVDEPIKWAVGNGAWDIATTSSWVDTVNAPTTYQELNGLGDSVVFDDTASGSSPITVTLNVNPVPGSITVNASKNYTISGSGNISGRGILTKSGSGTLTLSTANSFAGGININGGIVNFSALTNLGAGAIGFGGGTLQYNGNTDDISVRQVTLNSGVGTIDTAGQNVTFANPIGNNGAGGLAKTGAGTLTLNGTNKYSGITIVNQGTLALNASTYILNSPAIIINSGAVLDTSSSGVNLNLASAVSQILAGTGTVQGSVTAPTGTTISPATNGVTGTLHLANDLTVNGGVLVMDVSASSHDMITISGNLTLTSGTLPLTVSGTLANGTYTLITYSGSLSGTAGNLTLSGFSQPGKAATLSSSTSGQINLIITDSASDSIVWSGTGSTWDLAGTQDWLAGALAWAFTNGDFVRFDDSAAGNSTVSLQTTLQPSSVIVSNNSVTPYTFVDGTGLGGGKIGGSASLTKDGSGTLIMQTVNSYTGSTAVKNGTLQVGNGGSGDIGTGNVTNNGAIVFAQGDNNVHIVAGQVSGTGTLTQQGSATNALAQNNDYSGSVTISAGALQFGIGSAVGSVATPTVTDNATLILNRSGSYMFTNGVTGSGQVIKSGSATASLAANLTYQGNTYINNGTLKLTSANEIPDANSVSGSTGWLILDGGATAAGTFDMGGFNETVNALSGLSNVVSGVITNSSASATTTNALVILGAAATTYNGVIADNPTGAKLTLVLITNSLTLTSVNPWSGGAIVGNGATLALGTVTGSGITGTAGAGGITLSNGATLAMPTALSTIANFGETITTLPNSSATFTSGELANSIGGSLFGSSTSTNIIAGALSMGAASTEQWSNFLGTVLIPSGGTLRFSSTSLTLNGGDNTTFDVEGTGVLQTRNAGTVHLGALTGGGLITNPQANSGTGIFQIGFLNSDDEFSGSITGTNSIIKVGTGTLTFDGGVFTNISSPDGFTYVTNLVGTNNLINIVGATTISNGVLKLVVPVVLTNSYNGALPTPITLASATAVLDASQMGYTSNQFDSDGVTLTNVAFFTNGVFEIAPSQSLSGIGTIRASNVLLDGGSTLNPGLPLGSLIATNTVELGGAINMSVNATNTPNSSELLAEGFIVDPAATLTVTNLGSENAATFQLFNHAVTGFASVVLPTLTGTNSWINNLAINGSITLVAPAVVPPVNTNSTNITFSASSGNLTLSWPTDHTGWRLQTQTNSLSIGLGTNWTDVSGSTNVDQVIIPITSTNGAVFFRLIYP